jgi:hypothetical protein
LKDRALSLHNRFVSSLNISSQKIGLENKPPKIRPFALSDKPMSKAQGGACDRCRYIDDAGAASSELGLSYLLLERNFNH